MSDINTLKNIGNASAFWLKTVGIRSYDELKAVGAVEAYIRIHEYGIKTTKTLLYSLHGAIEDKNWKELDPETKKQLCTEAETKLKARHA